MHPRTHVVMTFFFFFLNLAPSALTGTIKLFAT